MFLLRKVAMPDLDEVTAAALAGAVEREVDRLRGVAAERRQQEDRSGWALANRTGNLLGRFGLGVREACLALGPMPDDVAWEEARSLKQRGQRMTLTRKPIHPADPCPTSGTAKGS